MVAGVESALKFLGKIKEVYGAESPEYQGFIDVMKDFKTGSADTRETIKRAIDLLQGQPELIEGYAEFLPPGNTVQLPEDPHGNILVMMPTGTMEIAQDGTVVNETHTQAPDVSGPHSAEAELAGWDNRLLENLRARIMDSGEHQGKYEVFTASFEAYLKMPPEQREASFGVDQGHEFVEKFKELLGDDELKKVLPEVAN